MRHNEPSVRYDRAGRDGDDAIGGAMAEALKDADAADLPLADPAARLAAGPDSSRESGREPAPAAGDAGNAPGDAVSRSDISSFQQKASGDDNPFLSKRRDATRAEQRASIEDLEAVDSGGFFRNLIIAILILGSLLWLGLLLAKKYMPGGNQLFASPALEVLGRTHLEPRRYISMVRVGKRVVVVGVSPDGMTPLTEITDGEEVAELMEVAKPKTETGKGLFVQLLQREVLGQKQEEQAARVEQASSGLQSSLQAIQARVRSLRQSE